MTDKRKLEVRNQNELIHWAKNKDLLGKYWGHDTPVGQARISFRSNLIASAVGKRKGLKVLEIGAGDGWYSVAFAKQKWHLTVTDLSPDLLKIAKGRLDKSSNIGFKIADAYSLPFRNNSFDGVIGSSILHHIDLTKALPEIKRVLKNGGSLSFCEPNMLNPQIAVQKNIPFFKKLAGDSPDETAYFRWQIKKYLIDQGFSRVKVSPIDFLHPKTPISLLSFTEKLSRILEKTPVVREIAGSLFISAVK